MHTQLKQNNEPIDRSILCEFRSFVNIFRTFILHAKKIEILIKSYCDNVSCTETASKTYFVKCKTLAQCDENTAQSEFCILLKKSRV